MPTVHVTSLPAQKTQRTATVTSLPAQKTQRTITVTSLPAQKTQRTITVKERPVAPEQPRLTVAVSERAVIQRINRVLKPQDEALRKSTGRVATTLGDYYILDTFKNCVVRYGFGLQTIADELKVLQPYESIDE